MRTFERGRGDGGDLVLEAGVFSTKTLDELLEFHDPRVGREIGRGD